MTRRRWIAGALGLAALLAPACLPVGPASTPSTLRLGYFPNLTHATAIVGIRAGLFVRELGRDVELRTTTFNSGPPAVEALFAGALDAAFIGPTPAINAFARSGGQAIRIVSGATSGGAFFVVRPGIDGVGDLRGKVLATPQLGGTQDVALRAWLKARGVRTAWFGGGDVAIRPLPNAKTLDAFRQGSIDGAWLPEPWATRLLTEGGGKVLVDERSLWRHGRYVTTHLVVRTEFLERHPGVVRGLLEGVVAATDVLRNDPARAQALVQEHLERLTGQRLPDELLRSSWQHLVFTVDPVATSLQVIADQATDLGILPGAIDVGRMYELGLLNDVLADSGRAPVEAP